MVTNNKDLPRVYAEKYLACPDVISIGYRGSVSKTEITLPKLKLAGERGVVRDFLSRVLRVPVSPSSEIIDRLINEGKEPVFAFVNGKHTKFALLFVF